MVHENNPPCSCMLQVLKQLNVFSDDDMEEASKALNDVCGSVSFYIVSVNKTRKYDISLIFVNFFFSHRFQSSSCTFLSRWQHKETAGLKRRSTTERRN